MLHALVLAALSASPAPGPGAALDRFSGTWESSGTFVDSPYSKAGTVGGTTACAWSTDGLFLICQQHITLSGQAIGDVTVFTYDSSAQKYRFFGVRSDGGNGGTIRVNATTVEWDNTFTDGGKTVMNRTLNIWDSPDLYHFRTEYSVDGGAHWTTTLSGTARRTAGR